MHGAVDPGAAKLRRYIDALDPPEKCVSPIAPFFCNHERTNRLWCATNALGDYVKPVPWLVEQVRDAPFQSVGIQSLVFHLSSVSAVEFNQLIDV